MKNYYLTINRKNYRLLISTYVLIITILFNSNFLFAQDQEINKGLGSQSTKPVSESWFESAMENLGIKPYAIEPSQNETFHASNQEQDLEFEITSKGYWLKKSDFFLEVQGLYANGINVFLPKESSTELHQNQLIFHQGIWSVEYLNSPAGLRQNFIVKDPGYAVDHLQVSLKSHGASVEMRRDEGMLFVMDNENAEDIRYYSLKAWDANKKPLKAEFIRQSSTQFALQVDVSNAEFPITIDPLSGTSLSFNKQADWTAESNQASAFFGISVSSAGDVNNDGYNDVIIGARDYDNGQTNEGVAFVYYGSDTGLSVTANWTMESNKPGARFGSSVASAGDVNNDGFDDVIIGAPELSSGQSKEGKVFVYHGSASGLSTTPNWTKESNKAGARMGESVASAGDINGDGYSDIIVGANRWNNTGSNQGRVYVYNGSSSGLSSVESWARQSYTVSAYYGTCVASAGDVNNDGYDDILIAAISNGQTGQENEGRIWVYLGSASGLKASPLWMKEGNKKNVRLGSSLSSAGDVNGDGYDDIIVGALGATNGQSLEGIAYVYHGKSSGLNSVAAWTMESNQATAYLGRSVSSAGDVNNDGFDDVIIGASSYDNGHTDEGKAFVFYGSSSGLYKSHAWTSESTNTSAFYGWSVSSAGDVNGDGYSDVLVGACMYNGGQSREGKAFAYHGGFVDVQTPALRPITTGGGMETDTATFYEHDGGWNYYYKIEGTDTFLIAGLQNNGYINDFDVISKVSHDDNWNHTWNDTGTSVIRRFVEINSNGALLYGNGGVDVRIFMDPTDTSKASAKLPHSRDRYQWFKLNSLFSPSDVGHKHIGNVSPSDVISSSTTGTYKSLSYIQFDGITSFSTFGSVVQCNSPEPSALPVELVYFNATYNNEYQNIDLNWQTANEINNSHFEIDRSLDGKVWTSVSRIAGVGNSTETNTYNAIDHNPILGTSFYRLVQVDLDGTRSTPEIRKVSIGSPPAKKLTVQPNPVNDIIRLTTDEEVEASFEICDFSGAIIKAGSYQSGEEIDVSMLKQGIYHIRLRSHDGNISFKSHLFVKN